MMLDQDLVAVSRTSVDRVLKGAGPLDRKLGIARVRLHTASPGTDANVPGLPREQAALLQDRLARRGEARLAGL